jgi:hypothetical protein
MLRVAQEEDWFIARSKLGPLSWSDSETRSHFIFLQTYARDLIPHP